MKKRIIAFLLAAVLLLGLMPTALAAVTCTVTLKNGESETPVQVEQGTAFGANLPSNPSKTGYTFLGWYNGEDKLTEETVIDADITYTAKFEPNHYSIAFNANGGSGSMQTLENVAYDEKVKLPKCTFTRDGYDFMGWSTSSYRNTADYGDKEVVEGLHSRDGRVKTLYAIWAGKTFEATFVYGYAGKDNETKTGKVGDDIDLPYVSETSRTGYLFDGWYRSAEGGDKVSSYASYTAADQNGVTFYAHWSKAIIVHYEGGEGYTGSAISDKTLRVSEVYSKLPRISSGIPANKALDGWYLKNADGTLGEQITKDTVINAELNEITLVAKWRAMRYTITFYPCTKIEGEDYEDDAEDQAYKDSVLGTMADLTVDYGEQITLPENRYTLSGYRFLGWTTDKTDSDESKRIDDKGTFTQASGYDGKTFTLYARWEDVRTDAQKEAEVKLNAAITALAGRYFPVCGTDTNVLEMLKKVLTDKGCDANITLSMKEAVSMNDAGIGADGQIQYKYNAEAPLYMGNTAYIWPAIVLTLDGVSRVTTSSQFQIGLDSVKLEKDLTAIMDRIEIPSVVEKPENLTQLFKYAPKAGVDPSTIDYSSNAQLITWATLEWDTDEEDGARSIGIGEVGSGYTPYPVTVTLPQTEKTVKLTGTIAVNGVGTICASKEFTVTVKAAQSAPVNYTKLLNAALTAQNALRDASTGETVSKDGVAGDVFVPNAPFIRDNLSNLGAEYKDFDNSKTPIRFFSSDPSVITIDGARATVYRPLPGDPAKKVTLTAQIRLRPEGAPPADFDQFTLLAKQSIELTVLPMEQSEIDAAAAFMKKVCTSDVYWAGIKGANTDKNDVTVKLQPFKEIVPDGDGYRFVYPADNNTYQYVEVDDLYDTSDINQTGIPYRTFRSSNNAVITHENLLVTKPEYDSKIKIDSLLTHSVYGKYYEKFKDDPAYADFAKFYKQPVSVTVTVKGEKGAPAPATPVKVTVSIDGSLATLDNFANTTSASYGTMSDAGKTAWDAVSTVLTDNQYTYVGDASYLSSVTDANNVTLSGGDPKYGAWSGWMYTVNGKEPVGDNGYGLTLGQYNLKDGDVILFHFVQCPTEDGLHKFEEEPAVAATCVSTGTTALKRCTVTSGGYGCGFTVGGEIIPVDPDNHTHLEPIAAVASTCTIKGHEAGQKCTDCNAVIGCAELPLAPHSWDAGVVTVQPTYVSTGVRVYTCSVCKQTRSEVIEKLSSTNTGTNTGTPAVPSQRPDSELPRQRFGDVPQNIWFASGVQFAAEQGLFTGVSANEFAPYDPMTRAMLVTVLHRLDGADASGTNSFTDVLNGKWYTNAIAWASANGIVEGLSGNRFAPNAPITREQLAAILFRYAKACGYDVSARAELTAYADAAQVSTWAGDAMRWAVASGLISGRSGAQLAPKGEATRAEVAVILMNFVQKVVK